MGSMKGLANGSTITDSAEYDAFGKVTSRTGISATQKGFVGRAGYQEDGESGYKLLGHRYYDPETGRFLSRDPIQDGRNWYNYCRNNPLKYVDPTGLQTRNLTADEKKEVQSWIDQLKGEGKTTAASDLQNMLDNDDIWIDTSLKGSGTLAETRESVFTVTIFLSPDLFDDLRDARSRKNNPDERATAWFLAIGTIYHEWVHAKRQSVNWKKVHPNQKEVDAYKAEIRLLRQIQKRKGMTKAQIDAIDSIISDLESNIRDYGGTP
jgi:RHS repeat-associated protein